MSLIGKFFYRWEHAQSGEIIDEPAPGLVLIRFDSYPETGKKPSKLMAMIRIEEMVTPQIKTGVEEGDYDLVWSFFNSREELDDLMTELDSYDGECEACRAEREAAETKSVN